MKIATRFRSLLTIACLLLAAPALACRPFGSYQFAEDKDGGIWFTEGDNNAVSRLAPDGVVQAHMLPTPGAEPSSLSLDPQGSLWFAESGGGKVGRLGSDGRIVEYPIPFGTPFFIVAERSGGAWFTTMPGHGGGSHAKHGAEMPATVGHVDPDGRLQSYPLKEGWPTDVALDRHGRAFVSILVPGTDQEKPRGRLARLDRSGRWEWLVSWDNSCPRNLVAAPDGALHFSDGCRATINHIDAEGRLRETPLPSGMNIQQMSLAADGTLWFTDRAHLGYFDRGDQPHLIVRQENGDQTMAILATRSGDVVFSEFYNYNINRLAKSGETVEHLVSVDERRSPRQVWQGEVCYIQFASRIVDKARMDRQRAEEIRKGQLKPAADGGDKLAAQKCLICHDTRRLLLSRRSDWSPSIARMQQYMAQRQLPPLSTEEKTTLVRYFNSQYGLPREARPGSGPQEH